MTQLKYPNSAITKAQIKKIHALVLKIRLEDEYYRALLYRFNVESSTQLNRSEAAEVIEILIGFEKEINQTQARGIFDGGRVYHLNRTGKATNAQIDYIVGMWQLAAKTPDYKNLMYFIKRVTKNLYLHIEQMDVKEASSVIVALEKWLKKEVVND